jgi:CP family cyanate transporter-like MFS transporter
VRRLPSPVATLLFVAALACPGVVGIIPSVLATVLIEEFQVSKGQIGLLLTMFGLFGSGSSLFYGRLTDSMGGERLLPYIFGLVSLALVIFALSPSYVGLLVAVGLGGSAAAAANPATNQLVAKLFPPGSRGPILGIKQAGGLVGVSLTGLLLPVLALTVGWRATVGGAALISLGFLSLARHGSKSSIFSKDKVEVEVEDSQTPQERDPAWLVVNALLMGAGLAPVIGFLPLYAQEICKMSTTSAGNLVGVAAGIGVVSRIMWGWNSGRAEDPRTPLVCIGILSALSTVAIVTAPFGGRWLLWLAAVGAGVSMNAWSAVGMIAAVEGGTVESTGRVSGVTAGSFFVGLTLAPLGFGLVADWTESYVWGWIGVVVLFGFATAAALRWKVLS